MTRPRSTNVSKITLAHLCKVSRCFEIKVQFLGSSPITQLVNGGTYFAQMAVMSSRTANYKYWTYWNCAWGWVCLCRIVPWDCFGGRYQFFYWLLRSFYGKLGPNSSSKTVSLRNPRENLASVVRHLKMIRRRSNVILSSVHTSNPHIRCISWYFLSFPIVCLIRFGTFLS